MGSGTLKKITKQQPTSVFAYLTIIVIGLIIVTSLFISCVQESLNDSKEEAEEPTIIPDITVPTVIKLSTTKESGSYTVGESINIIIEFSEVVYVVGTPQLTLETGITDQVIDYAEGSESAYLTFAYTVQAQDMSDTLNYSSTTSLSLNEGSILDSAGNGAVLTLPELRSENSLGNSNAIIINTIPNETWAKGFGGVGADIGFGMTVDSSGNSYITGQFEETINFGADDIISNGGSDIFIAKFDASGELIWAKTWGGVEDDGGIKIDVDDQGNLIFVGAYRQTIDIDGHELTSLGELDVLVVRLDKNGNYLWSKSLGGDEDEIGRNILYDSDDNIVLRGRFEGTANFGGNDLESKGDFDIFLAKYDEDGNHLWSESFGGTGYDGDTEPGMAIDNMDNILISGKIKNLVNFGGEDLIIADGSADMYIAKFNEDGNHVWSNNFGSTDVGGGYTGTDSMRGVAVDNDGNIYATGRYDSDRINFGCDGLTGYSTSDVFLVKFDKDGSCIWSKSFAENTYAEGKDIVVDASGNVAMTGYIGGASVDFGGGTHSLSGKSDQAFVARFDTDGNYIWSEIYGEEFVDQGFDLDLDSSGNLFLTGRFASGSVDFNGITVTNDNPALANYDIFLFKLETSIMDP